ncbi:MAG: biopolymer transporter ExbB [Rhodobacteraceae bacterium]|nr:biopolymer transporter ExbB [Paracoccaceae bacterium]
MIQAEPQNDPQFTQPVNQLTLMTVCVILVAVGGWFSYGALMPVFLANIYLNGFIFGVFVIGVLACFWQLLTLLSSVSWIEGFALNRPGHEFVNPPGLLTSLATLLRKRGARNALTSTSTQSILDSVASRLDEGREITRYIINLLIFLGLLGTFYGLAITVPAVVETIRSLAPDDGSSTLEIFDKLMSGLEKQMGGMGTAFGSSLLGLAGSLVVGMLDLFAGHGQNRFFRELEEWLSSITRIGVSSGEGDAGNVENFAIADMLEHTTFQMENLLQVLMQMQGRGDEADTRIERLSLAVEGLVGVAGQNQAEGSQLSEQMAEGQNRIAAVLEKMPLGEDAVWDAEAKMRLRNIDTQLLRILEEMSAGRQDAMAELRGDLRSLAQALVTSQRKG